MARPAPPRPLSTSRDLRSGSTAAHLLTLGGPMVVGIAAMMSMSLVDAFFIGRVGTDQLAAIGYTFPVVLTIQSLAIGLSAGAASVASRAWGEADEPAVRRIATDSLVLGLLVVLALTAIGLVTIRPLFELLGAEGDVLDLVESYMRVWWYSVPLLVVPQIATALLRAGGDSLVPSAIMVLAAVVNAALDPLLILGLAGFPRLEIVGAAWATFGVRAAMLVASIAVLALRDRLVEWSWPGLAAVLASWRRIVRVAAPASLGSAVNPLGITLVTAALSGYAASTVAGFGVATRIEAFAAIPMLALSAAIGPIAGQNWSGDGRGRAVRALVQAFGFCLEWSAAIGVALFLAADALAGAFTDDAAVAAEVASYLRIVPFSLAGYGIVTVAAGCFNAIDLAGRGLGLYLVRTAALYVPLAWAASLFAPSAGVYAAIAAANVAAGVAALVLSLRWLARRADGVPSGWRGAAQMLHAH